MNFAELAEFYLMVMTDPTITASPMDENTMPILKHNVRDYLIAKWGSNIAEEIEPLEIQKWLVSLRTTPIKDATGRVLKDGLAWPTCSTSARTSAPTPGFLAGRKEAIRNEVIERPSRRARTLFPGNTRRPLGTFHQSKTRSYGSGPKTATPLGVPTNTLPFTIVGVMNLLPAPN